jgi:hypothetical protein
MDIEAKHEAKLQRRKLRLRMETIRTIGSVCTIINVILTMILTTQVVHNQQQGVHNEYGNVNSSIRR